MASKATEGAMKIGGIATQKVADLSVSVSDKVGDERGGKFNYVLFCYILLFILFCLFYFPLLGQRRYSC